MIGAYVGTVRLITLNALRALDFQFEVTAGGRTQKMLNVADEFTREALAIKADRSIDADHVAILDRIAILGGAVPAFLRFDKGPEFIAHAVADWCHFNDKASVFIAPISSW